MGAFFVNFHVKTRSRSAVTEVLRNLINTRAYVSSPRAGWVSVYEERTSSQEEEEIVRLARELSSHLQKAVVGFLVHDSDFLRCWLFDAGQARPDAWLKYCKPGTTLECFQSLMTQERQGPTRAEDRLLELATLLGIDRQRAAQDFRDFERGEIRPEEVPAELVSAPGAEAYGEVAEEREERLAREYFLRECLQRLHDLRAKSPQGALIYAVAANLPDEVRSLLAAGADVNGQDSESRMTPLLTAVQHGHLELMRLLVQLGADVNLPGSCGPPLYLAVFSDHIDCARLLLEAGADVNGRGPLGTTPLIVAASQVVSRSMVQLLLGAGAQVRATSDLAVTALSATERIAAATQTEGTPIFHIVGRDGARSHSQIHAAALEIIQLLRNADDA